MFVDAVSMTPNLFGEVEMELDGGGRALERTVKRESTQLERNRVDIILSVSSIEPA